MQPTYDFKTIIPKFDAILERGLCSGLGTPNGQVCIEAAIALAMGLPFSDAPTCVEKNIIVFKIALNDQSWSTEEARAKGLRNIGIAQIGSKDVVDGIVFQQLLTTKLIKTLIPDLFKKVFKPGSAAFNAGLECSKQPGGATAAARYTAARYTAAAAGYAADAAATSFTAAGYAADAAANAANAAATADVARYTAARYAAAAAAARYAADVARYTADAAAATTADAAARYTAAAARFTAAAAAAATNAAAYATNDYYLIMVANLALECLKELKSPGCEWI